MTPYSAAIEAQMQRFYQRLSEKDRRRYAALEALKLGYGGRRYIRTVLGCDYKTLQRGQQELGNPPVLLESRIRRSGGGRKKNLNNTRKPMTFF